MGVSQYTITSVSEVPTPRSTPSEEDDDDDDDDRSAQSHHPPPPRMKSKGKRFFQATPKSTQKRVLIAQKAYCILSDSPLPGLFFRLLRCIALRDSSRNGAQSSRMLNRSQRSLSHDDIYVTDSMCSSYASLAGLHHTVMKDFLLHIQSFDIKRVNHALRKGALNLSYPGYVDHLIINPPIIALEVGLSPSCHLLLLTLL